MKAELRGPLHKMQDLWRLAKHYQSTYWAQPNAAARRIERDFPYPLACFTRGRVDGHLNFEHESMLGGDDAYGQGVKPAVLIVIDAKEYEAYHGRWPGHIFFLLGQSDRGIGYARDQFKQFAQAGIAMQDKTPLALPFYYEIDDLLHNFRQIVRTEAGDKQFVTAKQPNLLKAMLSLQRLPDLTKYGILGLGRDRGPVLGVQQDYIVNTLSIYKFRMVNVELTRQIHYIAALQKFEDIAFNFQLLHGADNDNDGGGNGSGGGVKLEAAHPPYIPTFKSYQFVARAAVRGRGGAAAGRKMEAQRCEAKDLLEPGQKFELLRPEHQAVSLRPICPTFVPHLSSVRMFTKPFLVECAHVYI